MADFIKDGVDCYYPGDPPQGDRDNSQFYPVLLEDTDNHVSIAEGYSIFQFTSISPKKYVFEGKGSFGACAILWSSEWSRMIESYEGSADGNNFKITMRMLMNQTVFLQVAAFNGDAIDDYVINVREYSVESTDPDDGDEEEEPSKPGTGKLKRVFKNEKLYVIDNGSMREVVKWFHRGKNGLKEVVKYFHNGKLAFSPYAFGGYIKDGLVLQLDCRHYDGSNKWTDLIDGIIIDGSGVNGFVQNEDKSISGSGYADESQYKDKVQPNPGEIIAHSIECFFTGIPEKVVHVLRPRSNYQWIYDIGLELRQNGKILMHYDDALIGMPNIRVAENVEYPEGKVYIYADYNGVYVNDAYYQFRGADEDEYHELSDSTHKVSNRADSSIYEWRVYNRPLIDDERDHNYDMDKKNFDHSVPQGALYLGNDDTLMLGDDYLVIE